MSREIKFRVWDGFNNCWARIEDVARFCPDGSIELMHPKMKLVEFTGLKDKNGKEIWEGDVVRWLHPDFDDWDNQSRRINQVGFYRGTFVLLEPNGEPVQFYKDGHKNEWHSLEYLAGYWQHLEVLGNIYENPELLK